MKKTSFIVILAVLIGLLVPVAWAAIPPGVSGSDLYSGRFVKQDKSN